MFRIQADVTGDEGVEGRRGKVQGRGCDYLPEEPMVLFLAITYKKEKQCGIGKKGLGEEFWSREVEHDGLL